MNKKHPIRIRVNSGMLTVYSDREILPKSYCRGCGKEIFWVKTIGRKKMPISKTENGEYISHFADCPAANKFRKKKKMMVEV